MIICSFHAKTSWERPKKSENKNYCSYLFLPNPLERIPKKMNKNSKN